MNLDTFGVNQLDATKLKGIFVSTNKIGDSGLDEKDFKKKFFRILSNTPKSIQIRAKQKARKDAINSPVEFVIKKSKPKKWDPDEDKVILQERNNMNGNFWNEIAKKLPGRTRHAVRSRWRNTLYPQTLSHQTFKKRKKVLKCIRCGYMTNHKQNFVSHVEKRKPCEAVELNATKNEIYKHNWMFNNMTNMSPLPQKRQRSISVNIVSLKRKIRILKKLSLPF
jgi:hypothetical protein